MALKYKYAKREEIPAEVAWRRARKGRRPLARDRNGFGELLARRHPLYMEVADATLPATGRRIWERALGPVRILTELPPGTRMAGFYSFREIAAAAGGGDLHNQTMSITLFEETTPLEETVTR